MGANSKIEWCDHTWNPWIGCTQISPGCHLCYAKTLNARFGGGTAPNWGPGAPRRRTSQSNWFSPFRWQRAAAAFYAKHGRRQTVFCASLADVFDNAVDPAWRADLGVLIENTPDLIWLVLTKRIGNAAPMLAAMFPRGTPENVWLGATVVDQAEADRDIPKLLATRAMRRFLSCEPLLGPVNLIGDRGTFTLLSERFDERWYSSLPIGWGGLLIDWVIVGGESGPGARPMHPAWARTLRDQCAVAGIPFLFKQWGEFAKYRGEGGVEGAWLDPDGRFYGGPTGWPPAPDEPRAYMVRYGKKAAGRLLDGVEHNGFPHRGEAQGAATPPITGDRPCSD